MGAERTDLAAVLTKTALLSGLTPAELQLLAARTVRKQLQTGELLFSEGEPCHGLHIIACGKVRIFKISLGGREQVLAVNTPGESVAELPVFDGGPYPASAVAIESTEIAFISRRDFQAYCMEHPEVALKVLATVGARLRRLVGLIEELSFTTIRQRLITALLRLAESQGKQTERGIEFQLPASHQAGKPAWNRARTDLPQPDAVAGRRSSGGRRTPDCSEGHEGLERAVERNALVETFLVAILVRIRHQLHIHIARNIRLPVACRSRNAD